VNKKVLGPPDVEELKTDIFSNPVFGLFHDLENDALEYISKNSVVVELSPGYILYNQGDSSMNIGLYIVMSGEVEVLHVLPGKVVLAVIHVPGEICGEVEHYLNRYKDLSPRQISWDVNQATLRSPVLTRALWIPNEATVNHIHIKYPKYSINVIKQMCYKLMKRSAVSDPVILSDNLSLLSRFLLVFRTFLIRHRHEIVSSPVEDGWYIFSKDPYSVNYFANAIGEKPSRGKPRKGNRPIGDKSSASSVYGAINNRLGESLKYERSKIDGKSRTIWKIKVDFFDEMISNPRSVIKY
jgi:hypothetical protein